MASIYDACERLNKFANKRGPQGVARAMRMTGCKGIPTDAEHCVLHDYLSKKFPDVKELAIDGDEAAWQHDECYRFGDALKEFTTKFDNNEFPELELKN